MQGRDAFTGDEIARISGLLTEKSRATRSKQKAVRAELRSMSFYISDFDATHSRFSASDLDRLIKSGRIRVVTPGSSEKAQRGTILRRLIEWIRKRL